MGILSPQNLGFELMSEPKHDHRGIYGSVWKHTPQPENSM